MDTSVKPRTRVAILGGGMSSLTAAMQLTDPRNPRHAEYDITVYQMGWRVGGKGASGRNLEPGFQHRIEEHGLHIWFGCYDNAFRLMREAYRELNRPPDAPLASWLDAFKPHTIAGIEMELDHKWLHWVGGFPLNDSVPGEGGLLPPDDYIRVGIRMFYENFIEKTPPDRSPTGDQWVNFGSKEHQALQKRRVKFEEMVLHFLSFMFKHLHLLAHVVGFLERVFIGINKVLLKWLWRFDKHRIKTEYLPQRRWILLNFMFACYSGIVKNSVLGRGFHSIDGEDFRDWLRKYAVEDENTMLDSFFMMGLYDGMFAYEDGDNSIPPGSTFPPKAKMEAGEALKCCMRQALTYKGAGVWKMQAGMGDTVFTPMYEILKKRGVKFALFHRVDQVLASADGSTVERINLTCQARIRPEAEAAGGYDPLITVKGLACWPSTPLYDQLVDGAALKASGVNLEDYGASWPGDRPMTLEAGKDFDQVILGISLGALPYIACDLIKKSPRWQAMITRMRTTRTMASQMWFARTAWELGWTAMAEPVVSGYETGPLDTWADMSHLIAREAWRPGGHLPGHGRYPLNLAYFCGVMKDDPPLPVTECGPKAPLADQNTENRKVEDITLRFVNNYIGAIFPNLLPKSADFQWDWLVDQRVVKAEGPARLGSQYFRANVQPSERYVLSVPGSNAYRLNPHDEVEFTNLYVTGDWIACGLNMGCIEAATMSGLLTSHAVCGYPPKQEIIGLDWRR
ncbi:MAG TPA: NAD(P)-binding protein [Gemmatimonadales bacterium]|nr:NAD(P)-binding protein [Gemmatimonadales bacterium]